MVNNRDRKSFGSPRKKCQILLSQLALLTFLFRDSLCESGNTNHKLANNGSCVSTISIVTRLQVTIPSSLGSTRSKGMP